MFLILPPQGVSEDYESSSLYSLICDLDHSNSPVIHSPNSLIVREIKMVEISSGLLMGIDGSKRIISISKIRKITEIMKNWLLNGGLLSSTEENPHSNSLDWLDLTDWAEEKQKVKADRMIIISKLMELRVVMRIVWVKIRMANEKILCYRIRITVIAIRLVFLIRSQKFLELY